MPPPDRVRARDRRDRQGLRGPVPDLGSGPGGVTALLHTLGVPVFGVDLSPAMVAPARETHPGLRFPVGSMTAPDLPDAALSGVLASGRLRLTERFGHEIDLDSYWRTPEQVVALPAGAGLELVATVRREPSGEERRARAFVLVGKAGRERRLPAVCASGAAWWACARRRENHPE